MFKFFAAQTVSTIASNFEAGKSILQCITEYHRISEQGETLRKISSDLRDVYLEKIRMVKEILIVYVAEKAKLQRNAIDQTPYMSIKDVLNSDNVTCDNVVAVLKQVSDNNLKAHGNLVELATKPIISDDAHKILAIVMDPNFDVIGFRNSIASTNRYKELHYQGKDNPDVTDVIATIIPE